MLENLSPQEFDSSINAIAKDIKQRCGDRLYHQYNRLRVLGMAEAKELREVYTNINVIESPQQIKSRFNEKLNLLNNSDRFGNILGKISDRLKRGAEQNSEPDLNHTYLHKVAPQTISGIQAVSKYPKLVIWGKAGSGKTIFLKYLALQCLSDNFQSELVPILINLWEFIETAQHQTLSAYIIAKFVGYGVKDPQAIQQLMVKGKLLILLDGLDAVESERSVIWAIKRLEEEFPTNQILITCRTGACAYNFEAFTEVEIADFNNEQVNIFIRQWFKHHELTQKFKDNLADAVAIQDLATSPLLLTFLCLLFETSNLAFNYAEVMAGALELLMDKWDAQRNIERNIKRNIRGNIDPDFSQLPFSKVNKLDLLSYIAIVSFDQDKYLLKQSQLEHLISTYCQNYLQIKANKIDAQAVVSLMESHHGLLVEKANHTYAFWHLIFQEYFTAKRIVNSANPHAFTYLKERIGERPWHNVIVLAAGMLLNADELVQAIKFKTDLLLAKHQRLQEFLTWIHQHTAYLKVPYSRAAIRAFYLDVDLNNFRVLDRARALDQVHQRTLNRIEAKSTETEMFSDVFGNMDYVMTVALNIDLALYVLENPVLKLAGLLEPELRRSLQQLKAQPPNPQKEPQKFKQWWNVYGMGWAKDFRTVIIQHRKGTQDWEFTAAEEALLKQYHDFNMLLVNCLNMGTVTPSVRQEILETLFLPVC